MSRNCFNSPSFTLLLKRTSAPSCPPRTADVGAVENLIRCVVSALSTDTIILQPHKTTRHTFISAAVHEVSAAPSFLSLASLENSSFKIKLKCHLLEKNFINSPGLWVLCSFLGRYKKPLKHLRGINLFTWVHTKAATYILSKVPKAVAMSAESMPEPEKRAVKNASWRSSDGWEDR